MEVEIKLILLTLTGAPQPLALTHHRVLSFTLDADAPFALGDEDAVAGATQNAQFQQVYRDDRHITYDLSDVYVQGTGELRIYTVQTKAID
jgi:hypothetical protein